VVIIHGSAMTPGIVNRHWYKWLQAELIKLSMDAIAPAFPDEKEAKDSVWISFLINDLKVQEVSDEWIHLLIDVPVFRTIS
jgi:hypothetical protein